MLKVFRKLGDVLAPGRKVDSHLLEELEEALIEADVKAELAMRLIEELGNAARTGHVRDAEGVRELLRTRVAGFWTAGWTGRWPTVPSRPR